MLFCCTIQVKLCQFILISVEIAGYGSINTRNSSTRRSLAARNVRRKHCVKFTRRSGSFLKDRGFMPPITNPPPDRGARPVQNPGKKRRNPNQPKNRPVRANLKRRNLNKPACLISPPGITKRFHREQKATASSDGRLCFMGGDSETPQSAW